MAGSEGERVALSMHLHPGQAEHEVMRRWRAFMADIMAIAEDGAAVVERLEPRFHLP